MNRKLLLISLLLGLLLSCRNGAAQTPTPTPDQAAEVIRVNTELVQTDVMVFDKSKAFVGGLRSDQFELLIDGKPQPVSFFEQVKTGSSREAQMHVTTAAPADVNQTAVIERPRTIVFFIDDLHLEPSSLERTRKMLQQFIDTELNENDRVAIASSSGDLGFLQQFTDNKFVLRAATDRLTHHPYKVGDMTDSQTPMTEYMALTIERKDDPGAMEFYIDRCMQEAGVLRYRRETCEVQIKSRARLILLQASSVILNTYSALESLMRSAATYSGRKLVFFISDGFLLDTGPRNSDPRQKLNEITDAALRAGVVVYTIDARGLFSGQLDATNNVPFDKQNRLESVSLREGAASQDALNALAGDTGGRALRNQNYFDRWVNNILDETSQYYVLAWRPNSAEQTAKAFRNVSVRVIGHPEYSVRLARGVFNVGTIAPSKTETDISTPAKAHADLQKALTGLNPKHEIPASLALVYLDTPDHGAVLTASVRLVNEALSYESDKGAPAATVDLVGVIANDRGKPAGSFQTRLNINERGKSGNADDSATIYNSRHPLAPGLYQVRVAARDAKTGHVGSAQQWIQIPDVGSHRLMLSSLLLGLQSVGEAEGGAAPQVQFSVDHRFAPGANLGFMAFVYNADQSQSSPKLSYQARILKNGRELTATPWNTISETPADRSRIICSGQIPLNLPAGRYTLELRVTDDVSKAIASEQTRITIE